MHGTAGYFNYWGKADSKYDGEPKWHPLAYHCLDVSACAAVLLDRQPMWLAALSRLSGLEIEWLRPWLHFQQALHDIGKLGDGFQAWRADLVAILQGRSGVRAGGERHDILGYLLAEKYLLDWLGLDGQDPDLFDLIQPWVAAVTGHHGRPANNLDSRVLLLRNHFSPPVVEDARIFVTAAAILFLPEGFDFPTPEAGLAERYRQASWLVAGLTVAADWLGSNTRWFRYHAPDLSLAEYWKTVALPQARQAVEESGLVPAVAAPAPGIRTLFPALESLPLTGLQNWAETVNIADGPQVFILEDLTGAGKTEAALTLAARLMATGGAQGVYLALPTMATADAMFDRVRRDNGWRRFFAGGAGQLALAHSADWLKLRLEAINRRDADYGPGEDTSASRHCSAWLADSRKKALLADFGVGTLDQALLAVLPVRHQSLRLLGLAHKVLIVDEVHACDCYMGELLARLLRFHAALGGSAILLSATLPQNQRTRYLQAFAQGAGIVTEPPKSEAYPLATRLARASLVEQPLPARESVSRRVEVTLLQQEAQVIARLEETIAQSRCAVWVRNTVADAVDSWRLWNTTHPDQPATLFHARFALHDRLGIGSHLLADFGPNSSPATRCGRLVIATQVVEQSLDVDFDDMVSDLAPIDLLIQRAGRLQRHRRDGTGNRVPEETPDGRSGARLAVLAPEPTQDADAKWIKRHLPKTGKVYPDHGKLWLTARWLLDRGGFEVPRQAREMIEAVYDDASFERLPEKLRAVADAADGACRADRGTARGNLLNFDEGYTPTSLQWQDEGEAPTRLGEATVRVRLARVLEDGPAPWAQVEAGIAWALSELTVPRRLIAAESAQDSPLIETAKRAMPDEGRYTVIIALRPSCDIWRGRALRVGGEEVQVAYSPVCGLTIAKGVEDESDL